MKATSFCEGCGDPFVGNGLYCEECGAVPVSGGRVIHKQPKFGGSRDPKRDRIKYRVKKAGVENAKVP